MGNVCACEDKISLRDHGGAGCQLVSHTWHPRGYPVGPWKRVSRHRHSSVQTIGHPTREDDPVPSQDEWVVRITAQDTHLRAEDTNGAAHGTDVGYATNGNLLFAKNITPALNADGLSPFNLVFGRKPRLAASDICFPAKKKVVSLQGNEQHRLYLSRLHSRLQSFQFRALESSIEAKERLREVYDKHRAVKVDRAKVGDIVCIHKPTRALKKLVFQWSEPTYIVVAILADTYEARYLAGGDRCRR